MQRIRRAAGGKMGAAVAAAALALSWGALFVVQAKAYDFDVCQECHESLRTEDLARPFLHPPFVQRECARCHAAPELEEASDQHVKTLWIAETDFQSAEHAFLLPAESLGKVLIVDVMGPGGRSFRQEVALPSLDSLEEVEDGGKAPTLSGVQVLDVRRGLFVSATLAWETDTLADAAVRYGEGDLSHVSGPGTRVGRKHRVVVRELGAGKAYQAVAVSRDLFGRTQVSEPVTFSTANLPPAGTAPEPENPAGEDADDKLSVRFSRRGDGYLIELSLAAPASVILGTQVHTRQENFPDDEFHEGLSGGVVSSLRACDTCHERHLHPVNVAATKEGVVVPPEFPTLPGGRIACASCHMPHSSHSDLYLRASTMQELCVGCHGQAVNE